LGYKLFKVYKVPFKHVTTGDSFELIFLFSKNVEKELSWNKIRESYKTESAEDNANYDFKKRAFPKVFNEEEVIRKFKEISPTRGISREYYKDPTLLGMPSHAIEYQYGTWNNFIRACGLEPQYEAETPHKIVSDYFQECLAQNKAFSFYEYGKIRGTNYTLKMKRLFNAGKKYSHLKEELFQRALDKDSQGAFLGKLS
jgi:hypothetical protein